MRHGFRGVFFFCILCRISALYGRCLLLSDERHCCMRILRKPARLLRFFYSSRFRAVAGPVSASLRTESRRLLGDFSLSARIVSVALLVVDGAGRSPHLRALRPESGRRAGFRLQQLFVDQVFDRVRRLRIRCSPWRCDVRSLGNSTMSMLLSFWFFAFRRKNDTVAAELCGRKAWAAVVSGIRGTLRGCGRK